MTQPAGLKLDHVVFPVRDVEATLRFYRNVLGLPLLAAHSGDDWDGYPWLMMIFGLAGGQEIVAVNLAGAPAPDYRGLPMDARHYALAADSEAAMDGWRSRLSRAAIDFWEEHHGDQRSIYFADPDGVVLEVTWPASSPRRAEDPQALETVLSWARQSVSA
jgi:catechol 2,3-dioxygenase-like lactoylglutathione lyase family enzyme